MQILQDRPIASFFLPWLLLLLLGGVSACGFYLRGANINLGGHPSPITALQVEGATPALNSALQNMARAYSGLTFSSEAPTRLNAIAPLPSAMPSQPDGTLRASSHRVRLQILDEQITEDASITDQTTRHQSIHLIYRLRYRLLGDDGQEWRPESLLERESRVSFSENDRLTSENRLRTARDILYQDMARTLIPQSVMAKPPSLPPSLPPAKAP